VRKRVNQISVRIIGVFLLMFTTILLAGCMSIHTAARAGNVGEVKRQLAWGVNPNSRTFWYLETPLILAATYGRTEIVKLLLEKGADVNLGNEGSETPLHYAARHGHIKVMEILLENGADVSEKGTGCGMPLQWAAQTGQIKAAELLLAHGADIHQKGTDEWTALGTAVSHGQVEMVKYLLSKGADVNARAIYGGTPLHVAAWRNYVEIGRILLEHDADPTLECNGRTVSNEFLESLKKLGATERSQKGLRSTVKESKRKWQ
jgi:ankyrin repeat protein